MNTEDVAEEIASLLMDHGYDVVGGEPEQDMRSGGHYIDVDREGEQFTILITTLDRE